MIDDVPQTMATRLRVHTPREQHRAGEVLCGLNIRLRKFGSPELAVERCVVRHHVGWAYEPRRVAHHVFRQRCVGHHGVGDAGELGDE